jgi:hypothetical protein
MLPLGCLPLWGREGVTLIMVVKILANNGKNRILTENRLFKYNGGDPSFTIRMNAAAPKRDAPAADQNDSKKFDFYAKSNWINLIAPPLLGESLKRVTL